MCTGKSGVPDPSPHCVRCSLAELPRLRSLELKNPGDVNPAWTTEFSSRSGETLAVPLHVTHQLVSCCAKDGLRSPPAVQCSLCFSVRRTQWLEWVEWLGRLVTGYMWRFAAARQVDATKD